MPKRLKYILSFKKICDLAEANQLGNLAKFRQAANLCPRTFKKICLGQPVQESVARKVANTLNTSLSSVIEAVVD